MPCLQENIIPTAKMGTTTEAVNGKNKWSIWKINKVAAHPSQICMRPAGLDGSVFPRIRVIAHPHPK
jgi:hypothetical protein